MVWKIISVVCLAASVYGSGKGPAISQQMVIVHEGDGHKGVAQCKSQYPEYYEEYTYPSYEFAYKVQDPYTKDFKGQSESRHGDEVKGDYWLIEPDGRTRTVQYHAAKKSGFKAEVKFSAPHQGLSVKGHPEEHNRNDVQPSFIPKRHQGEQKGKGHGFMVKVNHGEGKAINKHHEFNVKVNHAEQKRIDENHGSLAKGYSEEHKGIDKHHESEESYYYEEIRPYPNLMPNYDQ